ncbi:MAG: hypothetical protein CMJ16_03025 [Peredibacter sp.]|nr:hypothetical protein [Peredibacter sp.]
MFKIFKYEFMDYRYLEAFILAGKTLNFTAAAKELNVTPAALSRQIRLLEESVGKQLFIRSPQKVIMTKVGQELFNLSKQFKSQSNALLGKAGQSEIRIGCITPILNGVLAKFISDHYRGVGEVSFNIVTGAPSKILQMLEAGQIDIGLCNKNVQTDLLTSRKWLSEKPVLISKKKVNIKDLGKLNWILVEQKDYLVNYAYKKRLGRSSQITYVDSPLAQIEFVKQGLGVAIVSNWLVGGVKGISIQQLDEFKEESFYIIQPNSPFIEPHLSEFLNKIASLEMSNY